VSNEGGSNYEARPAREPSEPTAPRLAYPDTYRGTDVDEFHGDIVPDPFRWMEDADDPKATDWVGLQNTVTSQFLHRSGMHDAVAARLRDLWNYSRSWLPLRVGRRTFQLRAEPLQEQPVLYAIEDGPGGGTVELVNPNAMASDGTAALTGWVPSPEGTLLAYAISHRGSDWQELRVRNTKTGVDLPEVIRWVKSEEDVPYPNVAWLPDGASFYYNRLPAPGSVSTEDAYRFSQVYWHRVGTPQGDDVLIFDRPDDPDLNFVPIVTDDGRFLVLHAWRGLSNRHQIFFRRLGSAGGFTQLFPRADARRLFIGSVGDRFYFHTNAGAPLGRVIAIDVVRPASDQSTEIVPEGPHPIGRATMAEGRIVLVTVQDACHHVTTFDLEGTPGKPIDLPCMGTVSDLRGDPLTGELLVQFESFLQPRETLRYDPSTGELVGDRAALQPGFKVDGYTTRKSFYPAADGTRIPITLVHKVGLQLDGTSPALLYGYGGFNVSLTPQFDASRLLWLEAGGIYAVANLRGGGEYGEAWHEAGMLHQKQTVFSDFIAAAQWLIDGGFTTPSRLVISAESNGGLLVAACMLQRPELFAAVVSHIPVTDMLRYPRLTIGRYWVPEYGDAEADADAFRTLHAYSPLHNVRADVAYPPILVTTGASDDRVVPAHAMKFVAALQDAAGPHSRPMLLRVQRDVGHGLGKATSRVLELDADICTFAMATCGMTPAPLASSMASDTSTSG
jgi:prolyl oligopeptidase